MFKKIVMKFKNWTNARQMRERLFLALAEKVVKMEQLEAELASANSTCGRLNVSYSELSEKFNAMEKSYLDLATKLRAQSVSDLYFTIHKIKRAIEDGASQSDPLLQHLIEIGRRQQSAAQQYQNAILGTNPYNAGLAKQQHADNGFLGIKF